MQKDKISILCTRPVSDSLQSYASSEGVDLYIESFIETEPVQTIEVQQEIEQAALLSATVVFTSMNAVEAVATVLDGQIPNWQIFCIGHTTKELVEKYFGEESLKDTADDAAMLADTIVIEGETDEVIFFCGDQRRSELIDKLEEQGVAVNEIVVYQTIETPHKVQKHYNGIIFFSPTAVRSFFKKNQSKERTIFFAIGNTTATEIKKFTNNKIIIGDEPSKEKLVETAIDFFVSK